MKTETVLKQEAHKMCNGVLEDHQVAERFLRKHGKSLSVSVRERLYQELACIKRDIFEVREQLVRTIHEAFATIDKAEQSGDVPTAKAMAARAVMHFSVSAHDAQEKIKKLIDRLTVVVDTVSEAK